MGLLNATGGRLPPSTPPGPRAHDQGAGPLLSFFFVREGGAVGGAEATVVAPRRTPGSHRDGHRGPGVTPGGAPPGTGAAPRATTEHRGHRRPAPRAAEGPPLSPLLLSEDQGLLSMGSSLGAAPVLTPC